MAQFRVGRPVRYISGILTLIPAGSECEIVAIPAIELQRRCPSGGVSVLFNETVFHVHCSSVVPLTDPGADAFLARIRKLGSEPVNDAAKVEVTR
jgi:hypothetical protein